MTDINAQFRDHAARIGVSLRPETEALLLRWLHAVLDENTRVNLTALRTPETALDGLLIDSLALELHLNEHPLPGGACIADCGSGGGFPGVVAALLHPDWTVHLVESRAKKLKAVERAVADLPHANLRFDAERMEALALGTLSRSLDLVLSRAVGTIAHVLELCHATMKPGAVLLLWKSDPLEAEEESAGRAAALRFRFEWLPPIHYTSFKPSQLVRLRRTP